MSYYPDREAYLSSVGDAVGEAQENMLNDWVMANREILKQIKKILNNDDFQKVEAIIKKIGQT